MRKTIAIILTTMAVAAQTALANSEVVDGVTWCYSISGSGATITSGGSYEGDLVVPSQLGGRNVTSIGSSAFMSCGNLRSIVLPETLTTISYQAFCFCGALKQIIMPDSVTSLGSSSFYCCGSLEQLKLSDNITSIGGDTFAGCGSLSEVILPKRITSIADWAFNNSSSLSVVVIQAETTSLSVSEKAFSGCPVSSVTCLGSAPSSFSVSAFPNAIFYFFKNSAGGWKKILPTSQQGHYLDHGTSSVSILSSEIRASDQTIMDVVYKVKSSKSRVKVRVLAFEDGERSFAKVVRPETFIEGTEVNVGDNVTPNVEHRLSWRVSSDWTTKLAKVKFEVLACESDLLPLELMTIPASDQYGAIKISWNAISEQQWFDALLWLYADKDVGLTLTGGNLRNGSTLLASGANLAGAYSYYDENGSWVGSHLVPNSNVSRYVYGKMGYSLLEGTLLNYANSETRLGLQPYGARQYAYKMVP